MIKIGYPMTILAKFYSALDCILHKEHFHENQKTKNIRYEQHPEVPLGIKAVVCAIYEPPQESSKDTLRILPDPNDEIVEEAASKMGLRKVGWIFTDLVPSATTANKVSSLLRKA